MSQSENTVNDKTYNSNNPLIHYAYEHSVRLHPSQKKLLDVTMTDSMRRMLGSPDEIQLLQNLVRVTGARKTIDVGVYTGYSALSIALALPDSGKVVALDVTDEYLKKFNVFDIWKEAGVSEKIDFRLGDAVKSLELLLETDGHNSFDYAFLDADKTQYPQYYELCMKLVRSGGIIAIDNTLWSGKVCDPKFDDPSTCAIRAVNEIVANDERVNVSFLSIADGVTLCFKK